MIESNDVTELFHFFVSSLASDGYHVQSPDGEITALLEQKGRQQTDRGEKNLLLDFSVAEFTETLESLGSGAEFMWPGTSTRPAGLRLLLTHLYEMQQTRDLGAGGQRLSMRDCEPLLVVQ